MFTMVGEVDYIEVSGYIKDLVSISIPEGADSIPVDNLIHNRLNIRYQSMGKLSARMDVRTRVFSGNSVRNTPNFGQLVT